MASAKQAPLLLLVPSLVAAPGGIQSLTRDVLEALNVARENAPLHVISKLDRPDELARISCPESTTLSGVGGVPAAARTLGLLLKVFTFCLLRRPDLIVVIHRNHAPIAFLMQRLFGIPYVLMMHGIEAWNITGWWHRRSARAAVRFWCISRVTAERVVSGLCVPPERCEIIPCTADGERFTIGPKPEALLRKLGLSEDRKIVLTVARLASLERSKGYDRVLEVLPDLVLDFPTVHYVLVGKGDDLSRIQDLIKQLGIGDRVTLAGFVPDEELPSYYQLCDVFALPSTGEGFGIVFLEALCAGKPCIGGADDGSQEPLRNGELGALVSVEDRAGLRRALSDLLRGVTFDDPERLRQQALAHFGKDRFAERIAAALAKVTGPSTS